MTDQELFFAQLELEQLREEVAVEAELMDLEELADQRPGGLYVPEQRRLCELQEILLARQTFPAWPWWSDR